MRAHRGRRAWVGDFALGVGGHRAKESLQLDPDYVESRAPAPLDDTAQRCLDRMMRQLGPEASYRRARDEVVLGLAGLTDPAEWACEDVASEPRRLPCPMCGWTLFSSYPRDRLVCSRGSCQWSARYSTGFAEWLRARGVTKAEFNQAWEDMVALGRAVFEALGDIAASDWSDLDRITTEPPTMVVDREPGVPWLSASTMLYFVNLAAQSKGA